MSYAEKVYFPSILFSWKHVPYHFAFVGPKTMTGLDPLILPFLLRLSFVASLVEESTLFISLVSMVCIACNAIIYSFYRPLAPPDRFSASLSCLSAVAGEAENI